jgi:hypothetical protein
MTRLNALAFLLPPMRRAVEELIVRMRARGYESVVHETRRSRVRSAELVTAGVSRAKGPSMHCFDIAADLPCAEHFWSCEEKGCDYYVVLGEEAAKLGLTWGGDWDGDGVTREQREHDLPHVQGVPATAAIQDRVRASSPAEIEAMLVRYIRTR